jgi:hypothetical protein
MQGGLPDERLYHVMGIMVISHQVLPPQQHLERCIGRQEFQGTQPFPRVLLQESDSHVVRGTAPYLHGVEPHLTHTWTQPRHVLGPKPRRQN